VLLRRSKKEIISQLPGRIDKNFFVEMTQEQMNDHNSYYDLVSKLVNKWIRQGFLKEEERQKLLINLNCMRMVCNSTYILNQKTDFGHKTEEIEDLLKELLENEENKIVIFSQWKRMFELIIKRLEKLKVSWVYLNGDLSARERKRIIEEFMENKEIRIFLSTDAGGVGVNLQSANILINVDIPWNPAVLDQRIGRIFRLGQKKHVSVYNFISKGTIEHRILHLLNFKRSVFTGVMEEAGENTVMLEGFMESVRAMTEVNIDETPFTISRNYVQERGISTFAVMPTGEEIQEKHVAKTIEKYTRQVDEDMQEMDIGYKSHNFMIRFIAGLAHKLWLTLRGTKLNR